MQRKCEDCTKCCEGSLSGEALGKTFSRGRPCHFVAIGSGCTVYAQRPKDPCATYKCEWLTNPELPEWMKPSLVDTIVDKRKTSSGIEYLNVIEAGSVLTARVLSNLLLYALSNSINIAWEVEGGKNWIGSQEFLEDMGK